MSNVVEFLERIGQDSSLRDVARVDLKQALNDAEIDPAVQTAIINGDGKRLEELLSAKSNVCAIVFTTQEDDDDNSRQELPLNLLAGDVKANVAA
jgi:hypothetical protein